MRVFETSVQELKDSVLREVAALAWEDRLQTGILDIPEKIIPGPEAKMRCCIYKERAVVSSRVKMALGGDHTNPGLVEVMNVACDGCPVTQMTVGPACRGCIATRCVHSCPKDAITIVNHKAEIDHSKCILCGKCLNACPYGAIIKNLRPCERACKVGAISMGEDRKALVDYGKCISCGACVYQCPFGAIMDKSYIVDVVEMLRGSAKWGYRVYAVIAPSIMGQIAPATLGQLVTGLKQVGFHAVREVALGADMTAAHEAEELLEKKVLTSSCCPAFVDYVEKNFPKLAERVSGTPSPMVMIGKHIKEQDPKAKVVFIGPCVAKKKEFQLGKTMGAIDCVLTFEEMFPLLESKGIDITQLEEDTLDEASGYGRAFAASGGVAAAVAEALKEKGVTAEQFQLNCAACSGIDACKAALLKMDRGIGDVNFIEGMACEGGCVQGAGIVVRSPKNQAEVGKHVKAAGERTIGSAVESAQ
ncbi:MULTISPECIES: monomeric [FeFe] hydrogenase [unclassified Flavonifractor]|uniref:monomeric [FeFe] hydrogenase n=1 Tax=Flavonifractor sp. An92 TaxID=1965666 RepID=UPI0013DE378D|nr:MULTISPECIES: monomeric [FeFe] hydrogenase [unclassified Flavonifractor]